MPVERDALRLSALAGVEHSAQASLNATWLVLVGRTLPRLRSEKLRGALVEAPVCLFSLALATSGPMTEIDITNAIMLTALIRLFIVLPAFPITPH